ncbi:hypothetical protein L2E82_52952 [Cichorium intybus]|nr:hypothetical protein L2E82_52952 [Cichorium intybus]
MCKCRSHGTFPLFGLQSSHLNICYYHQDPHRRPLRPGSRPRFCSDRRALLLIGAWHLPRRPGVGRALKRHPFSGLVDSAGMLTLEPFSEDQGRSAVHPARGIPPISFLAPCGFTHPLTRTHVRLLGPCFKTGRMGCPQAGAGSTQGPGTTGLSPSLAPPSRGLGPGPPLRTLLQTTIRTARPPDFQAGLIPVRSPLLRESFRIPLVRTSSELAVRRPGKAPEGAVPSPSPGRHAATRSRRGSSSSSPPTADGFGTGTPVPSPQSQSFSRGYGSILPTSLAYIVPSTRGCSPWRPDAVMSTTGRGRHSVLRIFKGRRGRTGHRATCGALPAAGPYLRLSRFQGGQAVKQKR